MVFSYSSRNIRIEHDPKDDSTSLYAECQTDNQTDWKPNTVCLDDYINITEDCKGFDI
jgi:hypothetical protein